MKKTSQQLIKQLIDKIYSGQETDGSFLSFCSSDVNNLQPEKKYNLTFPASLISLALSNVKNNQVNQIRQKITNYLVGQKSEIGSFNYWSRESEESKKWPDDLDDTFSALAAIYSFNESLLDGKWLSQIVGYLTSVEINEAGPYRTWLVDEKSVDVFKDVDLAVNSNVAFFWKLLDVELVGINSYVEELINSNQISSPYYITAFPVIYFISRFYQGEGKNRLVNFIDNSIDELIKNNNLLNIAFAITSLYNFKNGIDKNEMRLVDCLISGLRDSDYPYFSFYYDPTEKGKQFYGYCPQLCLAFYIEAINCYLQTQQQDVNLETLSENNKENDWLINQVKININKLLSCLQVCNNEKLSKYINDFLADKKSNEIILHSYNILESVTNKNELKISNEILEKLTMINVYGWHGYTLIDDLLDGDKENQYLSFSNIFLRQVDSYIHKLSFLYPGFFDLSATILNEVDEANYWELENLRFRDSTQLFEMNEIKNFESVYKKSSGYILTDLFIFMYLKFDDLQIEKYRSFFYKYLEAKQLNDDLHDWSDDFKKGILNPVSIAILNRLDNIQLNEADDNVEALVGIMEKIFWNEVIAEFCVKIKDLCNQAKKDLHEIEFLANKAYCENLLNYIEQIADSTLVEQQKTKDFLNHYK